jgi:hypothetical protein
VGVRGSAWEWECVGTRESAWGLRPWECVGMRGNAWECVGMGERGKWECVGRLRRWGLLVGAGGGGGVGGGGGAVPAPEGQNTSSVAPPRGSWPSMTTESLGQVFIFHGRS